MLSPGPFAAAAAAAAASSRAALLRPPLVVVEWSTSTPSPLTRPAAKLLLLRLPRPPTFRRGIATGTRSRLSGPSASIPRHLPTTTTAIIALPQSSSSSALRVAGSRRHQSSSPSLSASDPSDPSEPARSTFASRFLAPRPARPTPEPLPLPPREPNEPALKILYSAREDKIRRQPDAVAPKGSFWYYHFKIFSVFPEAPAEKTPRTWIVWHSTVFFKIFIFMGFVLGNLVVLAFGCTEFYIELTDPSPVPFSKKTNRQIRIMWMYTHLYPGGDLVYAGIHARRAMNSLENEMTEHGGWDACPLEWKRAYVDFCARVARLSQQLGNSADAYVLYQRILAIEPEVVDARRRSQAALGMSMCAPKQQQQQQQHDGSTAKKQHDNGTNESTELLRQAVQLAVEAAPHDRRVHVDPARPVLPQPGAGVAEPSRELLAAVQETGIHFAQQGKPADSLAVFLGLLRTLQAQPSSKRDACREASIMAYIGEVVWALGRRAEGLAWTKQAFEDADGKAGVEACRGCAEYAVANAITMTRELWPARGSTEEEVEREVAALQSRQDRLEMIRVGEEWRVATATTTS